MEKLSCKLKGLCGKQKSQTLEGCYGCSSLRVDRELVGWSSTIVDDKSVAQLTQLAQDKLTEFESVVGDPPLPPIDPNIKPIEIIMGNTFKNRDEQIKDPTKAARFNEGKPQWAYVHFKSLEPMVRVLEFGAIKYAPKNWMKPMDTVKILESMQRHLAALFDGEEVDSETGISHMGHIQCNAMFYNYHKEKENDDNRPTE